MTCIAGIADGTRVWMGGDAAGVAGWEMKIMTLPKVFVRGPFLFGCTGSVRMTQILQHHLEVEPQMEGVPADTYMVRVFVEAVRACLKGFGYAKIESNREQGGFFLVGYRGRLYSAESDFQVNESADGFDAVGVGAPYALAAMCALDELDSEARIRRALEIAAHFSIGVAPPFRIERV
jgi:ATP-dependent protease HslVU (ClpYQ) peptidase subunit